MSAVTASILVGTKNRVDLGIQPRWIVLLHEANGYAWHLLRLQLVSGDIVPQPRFGLLEKGAPGTRVGLDQPPGILWRAAAGGDLVGELALLLHLHAVHTPEVMAAVKHIEALSRRRVDLAALGDRDSGNLGNAVRIARATGGGLYLAATIMAGSRLTEEGLLELPDWEISIATTVLSRDWVRVERGHLEITDYRLPAEPDPPSPDPAAPATPDEAEAPAPRGGATPGGGALPHEPGDAGPALPGQPGETASGTARYAGSPSAEEREHARRFGIRRADTHGRARVHGRERARTTPPEVLPDHDAALDSTDATAARTWLDDFLRD